MDSKEIASLLDVIASTTNNWYSVADQIEDKIGSFETPLIFFFYAFRYMIVSKSNSEYYQQFGPIAPFIIFEDNQAFPPPLDDIDENIVSIWAEVLHETTNSLICSRLSDLLWIKKWNEREAYKFAQIAIESYCKLAEGNLRATEMPKAFERALDLASELRDDVRKLEVVNAIINYWKRVEIETNHIPKMGLSLLAIIMSLHEDEIPKITNELLDKLILVYEGSPHFLENLLTYKIKISPKNYVDEIEERRIQIWIEEAEKNVENGLIRHAHLLHALELARNANKSDIINEIRLKIQETPPESLEFKELSFDFLIPEEKIELFFEPFKVSTGWGDGFNLLISNLPPTGDYGKNIDEVNKQISENPFRFMAQNVIYGKDNLPITRSTSQEEGKEIALIQHETIFIAGMAQFFPKIIKIFHDKHGVPTRKELEEIFSTPIISEELTKIISEAVLKYLAGDYKGASLYLVPVIEKIIREMVKYLGLAIYKEPNGIRPGSVYSLGHLISQLEGRINESWRRYIKNILIEPLSLNLRNEISHGLFLNPGIEEASLLLHIVCFLRALIIENHS